MRTADLDFHLPADRIAVAPAEPRDAAKLLVCHRASGKVEHARVRDLPDLGVLNPGDLMVVNQTRVLPAYLQGIRTATGGRVTGLFIQRATHPPGTGTSVPVPPADSPPEHWIVLLESRGRLRVDETIDLLDRQTQRSVAKLHLRESRGRGEWRVEVNADGPTDPPTLLGRVGDTPLPPYIRRARRQLAAEPASDPTAAVDDATSYNTVFAATAAEAASVAAPTAGLHFTADLLQRLERRGLQRAAVDLRVGLGTFLPVQVDRLDDHPIHTEYTHVPPRTLDALRRVRQQDHKVLAVGTTTVRTLESLPHPLGELAQHAGDTDLFITPQRVADDRFTFRWTDLLLTNFHLPRSTLLALVAALPGVGLPRLLDWYRQAIAADYRFYSYGDAMLIV